MTRTANRRRNLTVDQMLRIYRDNEAVVIQKKSENEKIVESINSNLKTLGINASNVPQSTLRTINNKTVSTQYNSRLTKEQKKEALGVFLSTLARGERFCTSQAAEFLGIDKLKVFSAIKDAIASNILRVEGSTNTAAYYKP